MSAKTGIEWTDATWNPIRGCSRVSEGCRHCYAEATANRFKGAGQPYEGLVQLANGHPQWTGKIAFVEEHLLDPLKWRPIPLHQDHGLKRRGKCECPSRPRRIFVNSMSDLFHENVTDEMRDRIFAVMALAPQHAFQVLTKRPERMLAYFTKKRPRGMSSEACDLTPWYVWRAANLLQAGLMCESHCPIGWNLEDEERASLDSFRSWPLPNVWLGVSVENQKAADERIPLLLRTPAAVRFISAEPLLGAVDLTVIPREANVFDVSMPGFNRCKGFFLDALSGSNGVLMLDGRCHEEPLGAQPKLHWVICGGESGPGARPMHPDWAGGLRDQCVAAGVPFFFKQWGEFQNGSEWKVDASREIVAYTDGDSCKRDVESITAHLKRTGKEHAARYPTIMARVGKKAAGHLLDGAEWHQFPAASK